MSPPNDELQRIPAFQLQRLQPCQPSHLLWQLAQRSALLDCQLLPLSLHTEAGNSSSAFTSASYSCRRSPSPLAMHAAFHALKTQALQPCQLSSGSSSTCSNFRNSLRSPSIPAIHPSTSRNPHPEMRKSSRLVCLKDRASASSCFLAAPPRS